MNQFYSFEDTLLAERRDFAEDADLLAASLLCLCGMNEEPQPENVSFPF